MTPPPPKLVEQLIAWSLPPADRSAVLGDLAEEFDARATERGVRSARQWYRRQVRRSLVTNLLRRFGPAMPQERAGARPRRLFAAFDGMGTDLRYTWRGLREAPTFTVAAVLVLTLGVGASATIFSVVDAVVLRALPFDEPDRLVAVGERSPRFRDPLALLAVQPQNYLDWTAGQSVFESMAAFDPRSGSSAIALRSPGIESEDLTVLRVGGAFFEVLRVAPALGRTFIPDDEIEGRHRVAVLSDALWRRRFGGDAGIIGRVLELDHAPYQVVGVLPPGVTYPIGGAATDLWIPLVIPANHRIRTPGHVPYLRSIARLKTGVSVPQAQGHMDQLFARLEQADPSWHKDSGIGVEPLHEYVIGPLRGGLMMLLGAVGLVLLIACVNVASLVVARAAARAREVGIRAALGAGSGRLIRLFVIESLVLASLGTFCAILCATWTIPLLRDALPEGMPRAEEIALNLRVLAAAGGVTLLTALFFGVMPARPLRGPDLALPLKSSTRAGLADLRAHRLRDLLVIAELALAVILLVGAALFVGSFLKMHGIDPGISTDRVLTMGLTPRTDPTGKRPDPAAAFEQVVERLATVPGVMHAAIVWGGLPLRGGTHIRAFQVLGRPVASDDVGVNARHVTPDYHRSLGIPLRKGRMLEPSDDASALKVIVIGEAVASRYFPAEDPIGRSAVIGETAWTIVGVVGDVHDRSVETERRPLVYFPMAQSTAGPAELVVRTAAEPYDAFPAVKAALLEVMPDVSIRNVTTVGEIQVRQRGSRRLRMLIMGLFGAVGLAVSAVGLYGLMAFLVSRRTHEFGVRIALGATPERLIGTVLAHGGVIVAIGLAIGGVGAWLLRSVAESMLFPGLQSGDPRAFAAAIGVLSLSAVLAMLIPARRATRVDAVVVLRLE
jgi:predicted permease